LDSLEYNFKMVESLHKAVDNFFNTISSNTKKISQMTLLDILGFLGTLISGLLGYFLSISINQSAFFMVPIFAGIGLSSFLLLKKKDDAKLEEKIRKKIIINNYIFDTIKKLPKNIPDSTKDILIENLALSINNNDLLNEILHPKKLEIKSQEIFTTDDREKLQSIGNTENSE